MISDEEKQELYTDGFADGVKQGRTEGRAEGFVDGRAEGVIEVARQLLTYEIFDRPFDRLRGRREIPGQAEHDGTAEARTVIPMPNQGLSYRGRRPRVSP